MKRFTSLALIITMLLCYFPVSVLAANQTDGSMTVSYTIEPTYSYTVEIPSSININESNYFNLTAPTVNIPEDKRLYVEVDVDRSFTDSAFRLYKDKGTTDEHSLVCYVSVGASGSINGSYRISETERLAAKFYPNNSTSPQYGRLFFYPNTTDNPPAGTYIGTLYFTIYVGDVVQQ